MIRPLRSLHLQHGLRRDKGCRVTLRVRILTSRSLRLQPEVHGGQKRSNHQGCCYKMFRFVDFRFLKRIPNFFWVRVQDNFCGTLSLFVKSIYSKIMRNHTYGYRITNFCTRNLSLIDPIVGSSCWQVETIQSVQWEVVVWSLKSGPRSLINTLDLIHQGQYEDPDMYKLLTSVVIVKKVTTSDASWVDGLESLECSRKDCPHGRAFLKEEMFFFFFLFSERKNDHQREVRSLYIRKSYSGMRAGYVLKHFICIQRKVQTGSLINK